MKRLLITFVALVPLVASCSAPPPPPPPPVYSAADVVYMRELARGDTEPGLPTDAIAWGKQVCERLDSKTPVNEVLSQVRNLGWSDYSASVIVQAALEAYCPQHKGLFVIPVPAVERP